MGGKITISYMSGPLDGKLLVWDLPKDVEQLVLTIGRREGCDVLLDYDSQVSRQHARVIYDLPTDTFFLEDVGSRNGTFVGLERIAERVVLAPGELFRVGRTWLRVEPPRRLIDDLEDDEDDEDLPF